MKRLKKYMTNILSIALAMVVLLSTSGFKIYSHHCNTSHTHNYSIFVPAEECGHSTETDQNKNCCSAVESPKAKDDCCQNTEKVVQLKTTTLINQTSTELKISELNLALNYLVLNELSLKTHNSLFNKALISDYPPPQSVPEYLSFIQVYII